jgi:flagellum-specific ATP synthase
MISIDFDKYKQLLDKTYEKEIGRVVKMVGLTIEASGPNANLNDVCYITCENQKKKKMAEVVGFRENRILLMPYDDMTGVGIGSFVENTGSALKVPVGNELLGKTLDGLGNPMDETAIHNNRFYSAEAAPQIP